MRVAAKALLTVVTLVVALVVAVSANAQPRPGGGGKTGGGGPSAPSGGTPAGLVTGLTADQMVRLFTAAGFKAQVVDNNGSKMVQAVFWTPDIFGGAIPEVCEKDGSSCHAMKIFANLGNGGVDQKWIDGWNNSWLYVHAGNVSGNLIFSWDIGLFTGVTPDYLVAQIQLFKQIVDQSTDFKP